MLQLDIADNRDEYRSHLRISQAQANNDKGEILEGWSWTATTTTEATLHDNGFCPTFAEAMQKAKSELARQYQAQQIDPAQLDHLDHVR